VAVAHGAAPTASTAASAPPRNVPATRTEGGSPPVVWLRRLTAALVVLCGAVHFPRHWADTPSHGLTAALAVSACCLALGVALCFTKTMAVAAACVVVPGALAIAHLWAGRVDSATLSFVLDAGWAAHPLPALSAGLAALTSLAVVAMAVARRQTPGERRTGLPM